jgi:YidC/Oxa1 family membrane protein insertase
MNLFQSIGHYFDIILTFPLLNLLVFLYNYIPDIGIVIILVTVLVRLVLLPSFHSSLKHQRAMSSLQPKMNEIKHKYKDDKEAQAKAMMELYKVHKVNPLSSCFPLLLQLPILIALYQVFMRSLKGSLEGLYPFIKAPESIDPMFLNFLDLSQKNVTMAVLAGVLMYFQSRMSLPKEQTNDAQAKMLKYQTLYFLPILTVVFGVQFPAGLTLYWVVTTLFGIAQQYYILRKEAKEALAKAV